MNLTLKSAFPINNFKLAYETAAHKQVFNANYDVCLAIPIGKKAYLWITNNNECFIVDKTGVYFTLTNVLTENLQNTVFYGSLPTSLSESTDFEDLNYFVLEDIYYFNGKSTATLNFQERLETILQCLQNNFVYDGNKTPDFLVVLPVMAKSVPDNLFNHLYWDNLCNSAAYKTHHLQYRSSIMQLPYLNQKTAIEAVELPSAADYYVHRDPCKTVSPKIMQRIKEAVFITQADIQDDVYHLFAYNPTSPDKKTYINVAFIATLKDSIFMNKVFRKIRENDNIELGEESEDEDTFQNIQPNKYVDTNKFVKIRYKYLTKWRKWAPIAIAHAKDKVISLNQLYR